MNIREYGPKDHCHNCNFYITESNSRPVWWPITWAKIDDSSPDMASARYCIRCASNLDPKERFLSIEEATAALTTEILSENIQ